MAHDGQLTEPREASSIAFQDIIESTRIIAETASDAIITINEQSTILFVNRAAVKIFGYSMEEMLGAELTMLMPEYLRRLHRLGLQSYIETGNHHIPWESVELPGLHKSGKEISLELSFGEFQKDGQRFFTGIARDITKRKHDERRLALQHSVTEILAQATSLDKATPKLLEAICSRLGWQVAALWSVDSEQDNLCCVASWRHQSSDDLAEFEAASCNLRFRRNEGLPGKVWARKEPFWASDYVNEAFPRSDIAARGRLHTAFAFPISLGEEVLGVIELFSEERWESDSSLLNTFTAIGSQIGQFIERKKGETERSSALASERKARLEAEAANRAKDEFLTILSHELRTPLTPIIGWVHMMETGILPVTEFHKALSVINRNAYGLKRLINDLLDMSAILSGKMQLEETSVSLASVLSEAVETMRSYARDSKVQLRLKIADEAASVTIKGDRSRLNQAFCNVLQNAIKFSLAGGMVNINCDTTDSEAIISFKDQGQGIASEFLPHVFERFRQADASRTRAFGGLGLGLALVKSFVEAHGGTVAAASEGEGKGSVFEIKLPRQGGAREDRKETARKPDVADRKKHIRVLMVEDQPDTLAMLAANFQSRGYETIPCSSALEALQIADRDAFDILISDIAMPLMDGLQLIAELRQKQGLENIPAIALTGYASQNDADTAIAAGFDLHLSKPIDPAELAAAVETLLNAKSK
jgi:PAS domain S-box-containing protein